MANRIFIRNKNSVCDTPLKMLVLNLMPKKIETENQIIGLLKNTKQNIDVYFMYTKTHIFKNPSASHIYSSYFTFDEIRYEYFDGLIVTGAPVENIEFEQVDYWQELCNIVEWSLTNVTSSVFLCWAAQAALFRLYGVPKYTLPKKLSGVYLHEFIPDTPLFDQFDESFLVPHSRYTCTKREDLEKVSELEIISCSKKAGVYAIYGKNGRHIYLTGHPEYEKNTLLDEYERDALNGINPDLPENYILNDKPHDSWSAHSNLLFANWILHYMQNERTTIKKGNIFTLS